MANPSQPAPHASHAASSRIDVVLEPSFWVQHRVTFLGIALGIGALALGIKFVRDRAQSGDAQGWAALADPESPMMPRQNAISLEATRGTTAEPWALFQSARNQYADYRKSFDSSKLDSVLALLGELESKFSTHSLVRDGHVSSFKRDIEAERTWAGAHTVTVANPQPSDNNKVTLVCDQGEIEIGLYPDAAPSSVKSFLEMVRTADKASFVEANEGQSLTLTAEGTVPEGASQTAEPNEPAKSDKSEKKDPKPAGKDRNTFTHTKGCVSFLRFNQFGDEKKNAINVLFCLEDEARRDGSQVVFGVVTKGLDVLERIAKSEKSENDPSRLKAPLAVKSIREAAGLAAIK